MDRWKDGWKDGQKDRWKDGQTLFYRTLPAKAGGPISFNDLFQKILDTLLQQLYCISIYYIHHSYINQQNINSYFKFILTIMIKTQLFIFKEFIEFQLKSCQ